MKRSRDIIPVYDLCSVNPGGIHHEISAGPFASFLKIRDKLIVPHRHAYYHVILFTKGGGTMTLDFERYEILPGRIYFMIPGQVHCWDFSEDRDGYAVNFSENIFSTFISDPGYLEQFPFLRGNPKDSVFDLKGVSKAEAEYFFNLINNEAGKKDKFSLDQICFHLVSLFISISRHESSTLKKQMPEQNNSILFHFRKLVNRHFREKRLPKEYAAMLYITPHKLNTICTEQAGSSAGEIIRARIILESKRLLVNADLSISEIAYQLNFSDNSYFSKFFKKYTAMTPDEFRKLSAISL